MGNECKDESADGSPKVNRFNFENDPCVDLEIRIVGYSNHSICKLVVIEIIRSSIRFVNDMDKVFFNMFEQEVNIEMMGCVLAMKSGIPFACAKYLIDYDCIEYIDDGIIVPTKLTTKRFARNAIHESNKALDDKSSFSLTLKDKCNDNILQNDKLNPNAVEFKVDNGSLNVNAAEFKIEQNESKLNPTASEFVFEPKPVHQMNNGNSLIQQTLAYPAWNNNNKRQGQ